jgi:hypothetical protein
VLAVREIMIRRVGFVAVTGVLTGTGTARAHQELFVAYLNAANQSPPNGSPGVGTMLITMDVDIVAMHVQMRFNGLSGNASSFGLYGRTANPQSGLTGLAVPFPGAPVGNSQGEYDFTIDLTQAGSYTPDFISRSGGTISDALNGTIFGLLKDQMYLNIPTGAFPEGEIRGFPSSWPDAVRDGTINSADFNALASHFNEYGTDISSGDFNFDGHTNAFDFNALARHFGDSVDFVLEPPEDLLPVPEPQSVVVWMIASGCLRRRRVQSLHTVGD